MSKPTQEQGPPASVRPIYGQDPWKTTGIPDSIGRSNQVSFNRWNGALAVAHAPVVFTYDRLTRSGKECGLRGRDANALV
jgi:hypothetical protein